MVQLEQKEEKLQVLLSGDIDHHTAKEMREAIDKRIEEIHPKRLILDFKGVTFMDSSGIGLVMGRYKQMQYYNGEVQVVNTSSHIKRVMILAGLDKLAVFE